MRGSTLLLVGLSPIAIFASLVVGPMMVKWQPPMIWRSEFGIAGGSGVTGIDEDKTGLYVTGYVGNYWAALVNATPGYAFLKKFDFAGHEIWTQQLGDPGSTSITRIKAGSNGLYIAGLVNGTIFVEKYDFNGNNIWKSPFVNITDSSSLDIAAGPSGLYIVGLGSGYPSKLDPLFFRSYDFNGNVVITRVLTNETQHGSSLVYSSASNEVYVAGSGPPDTDHLVNTGAFVSRYDPSGILIWTRRFDNPPSFQCACIVRGLSGDTFGIYVGGDTFDRGLPGESFSTGGGSFLRKYDSNGDVVWTSGDSSSSIAEVFASSLGVYLRGGTIQRYDGNNGNRVWSFDPKVEVDALSADEKGVYAGGTINSGPNLNAFLASYSQSSSLIIGGINPPYSFMIPAVIIVPIFIILATRMRRNRLERKQAVSRRFIGHEVRSRFSTVASTAPRRKSGDTRAHSL